MIRSCCGTPDDARSPSPHARDCRAVPPASGGSGGPYALRGLPDHVLRYLGESAIARAAFRCDRCGAHWYPDMGERPPALCYPMPEWLRSHD